MNPTQEQLRNRLDAIGGAEQQRLADANPANYDALADAAGYASSPVPSPISVASLSQPQKPMSVLPPSVVPPPAITPPTLTTAPDATAVPTLESLTAQLSAQTKDAAATKALATAPFEKELNSVNQQLATKYAQSIANQEKAAKAGETTSFATREGQNIARTDAIEYLMLEARAAGLQGNITLAEKKAQAGIDAKYGQITQDITTKKQNIYANWDTFSEADKKRARAVLLQLDKDDAFVKEVKAEEAQIENMAMTALQFGATSTQADAIRTAGTFGEALRLGGNFLGAEFRAEQEQNAFDRGVKTREMEIRELELGLRQRQASLEAAKLGDPAAIAALGYDPNNLPLTTDQIRTFEDQKAAFARDKTIVDRALANGLGLDASAGLLRGGLSGNLIETGVLTTPFAVAKRNDFLADTNYILKNLTFNKIRELSDMGVKLTPISEKELKAMGDASNVLAAAAQYDDKGNLTGFKMSETRVKEHLELIGKSYKDAMDDITANTVLTAEERAEINKR